MILQLFESCCAAACTSILHFWREMRNQMQKPSACLKWPCVVKTCSAKKSLIPLFYVKDLQRRDAWCLGCQSEWKDDGLSHIESRHLHSQNSTDWFHADAAGVLPLSSQGRRYLRRKYLNSWYCWKAQMAGVFFVGGNLPPHVWRGYIHSPAGRVTAWQKENLYDDVESITSFFHLLNSFCSPLPPGSDGKFRGFGEG